MCSINVTFNMKTGECVNFLSRICSFEKILEPIFKNFSLIFFVA